MIKDFLRAYFPHARSDVLQSMETTFPAAAAKYNLNTRSLAMALGQVKVESGGMTVFSENLHYSAERLVQIFGVGRNSADVTSSEAKRLAGNEQAIAERVYGTGKKAKDLGNLTPKDGWDYRGGGPIQITGRTMFALVSKKTGIDFVNTPDNARNPAFFWDVIFGFFAVKNAVNSLNVDATTATITHLTRIVNGGETGLSERIAATNDAVSKIKQYNALAENASTNHVLFDSTDIVSTDKDSDPATVTEGAAPLDAAPDEVILADYGDKDNLHVKDLQTGFATLNYWSGPADGDFGVLTRDMLFAYQANNGFNVESTLRVKHINKLAHATARLLPDERANATAKSPALQDSFTLRAARWLKGTAVTLLGMVGVTSTGDSWTSVVGAVVTNRGTIHDTLSPVIEGVKPVVAPLADVSAMILLKFGAVGVAVILFGLAVALIHDRVEQHRNGANMHL